MSLDFAAPAGLKAFTQAWPLHALTDPQGHRWGFRDNRRDAPPLVLLPGALGNGDVAWRIAQALDAEARVLTVHYPSGLEPDVLADGLLALIDHLALGPVALWGSSYGAWWAQAFARRHPGALRALWLGNTFVDGADVAASPLFSPDWLTGASGDDVVARWRDGTLARPDSELRQLQLHMLQHGLPAEDFRQRLLKVALSTPLPTAPTPTKTVLCDCEDDAIITPAVRERVRQRYPHAHRVVLSAGGHYPHVQQIDALLPHLRSWLA